MYNTDRMLEMIRALRVMSVGKTKSPHKYLFLLTLARLYEKAPQRRNAFPLDNELERVFLEVCKELYPDSVAETLLIEFPYYHLTNDRVWNLTLRKGKEQIFRHYEQSANTRLTRKRLIETTEFGSLCDDFDRCFRDAESRTAIISEIVKLAHESGLVSRIAPSLQRLSFSDGSSDSSNPFVSYLNSLQRLNASNDNALAESQACNSSFAHIHVPHPLSQTILVELRNTEGRHVILTGHAGDGKSTIALEIYKQLAGIPSGEPLPQPLAPREDLPGADITIMKDLSERRKEEDPALVRELLRNERRFLLVSNTGTLLDLLRNQAAIFSTSEVQLESDVLCAIGAERGESDLVLGGARFLVVNLARMDNLELALKIFARMTAPERWTKCYDFVCRANCPILLNVDLINNRRDMIFDRISLAYRRMYEYGTRLTLRQITEHLAYLVTSGLEESDIAEMREKHQTPLKAEFMFFNRFFGDNGKEDHPAALQMRAVSEIRKQGFGERPCPIWERKLWLKLRARNFRLGVEDCDAEFDLLQEHGSGPGNDNKPGLTPDQAREQVRRMLYFLYDFPKEEPSYLIQFLNSPTILRWQEWQKPGARLEMTERDVLEHRIYHVLQEHFTGVRLPERATGHDRRLYITLSRGRSEIRQSAQVVLAQIDWRNETALELIRCQDAAGGGRIDLELQGRGRIHGANLVLTLPFLDYVVMRHFGEVGEILQAAYVERLERFKTKVQHRARETRSDIMLVRLKTDHTFRRQQYTVRDGVLEVNDVL